MSRVIPAAPARASVAEADSGPARREVMALFDELRRSEARPVPHLRVLRTTLRTLHLLAAAALYGGHVHGVEAARLLPALAATVATGGAFLALEVWRFPPWLVQLRGVATLGKLALLGAVPLFWEWRALVLSAVLAIGVVTAHMPGRFRYRSLLAGVPAGPEDKG
jgi:hypothetical protein